MNSNEWSSLSTRQLLALFAESVEELRRRGVVRSSNNPLADYTEWLVCRGLSLSQLPGSSTGCDAIDAAGKKYEIKSRRLTKHNASTQLSAIRGLDLQHFDYLVGVLFEPDFSIRRACVLPHDAVVRSAVFRKHVNAWILYLKPSVYDAADARDVTKALRNVQASPETG